LAKKSKKGKGVPAAEKTRAQVRVNVRTQEATKTEEAKEQEAKKEEKKKTNKKKGSKKKKKLLVNALFANAGNARKIAFVIDISGSMSQDEPSFGGMTRMQVVSQHLAQAIKSMEGAEGAAFGIALFNHGGHLPLGPSLVPATASGVTHGIRAAMALRADGGNGGEAEGLNMCLSMTGVQAIFFLGDGGWEADPLISAANASSVVIHSIAFFTTGGGLREISEGRGGTYREVHSSCDLLAPRRNDDESESEYGDDDGNGAGSGDDGRWENEPIFAKV
jgi:hypothetical protein